MIAVYIYFSSRHVQVATNRRQYGVALLSMDFNTTQHR